MNRRLDVYIRVRFDQDPTNEYEERVGSLVTNADDLITDLQDFLVGVAGAFEIPEDEFNDS